MQLNVQTSTQITNQQAASVQAANPSISNLAVGSPIRAILQGVTSVALWLQAMALQVLSATRLTTSSGSDVDSFIGQFELTRLPAVAATGQVTFSRYSTNASALLMPNTQVATFDLSQSYYVPVDVTNAAWNAAQGGFLVAVGVANLTVTVVAVTAGSAGNVLANTVGLIQGSGAPFDTVTNNSPIVSGADAETDTACKNQFSAYVNTRSLSTVSAIEYAATSVQSGLTANVQEYLGNVIVTVDDGSGNPPASLISEVYAAVQATRGAGIYATVLPPTVIYANVVMALTVSSGYIDSQIAPLVQTAIVNFISALPVGAPMPFSILSKLAYDASPAIINVTSIFLNASQNDIATSPTQVVRVGSIIIE
jgi:hypothetical protein